ncbi:MULTISPECIES: hypothetical protein [Nocardia]|uniref:Uncharacterized protein n=1 Tax=Nocardia aurea TaxID=2144174 RepID=A0ABV3FWZ1_9NOCA|nr:MULTISPECIES: hypothetical protein [Nocardia]
MKDLGSIRNPVHDGLFLILCDAHARFGGWDVHGDELADEGSKSLVLDGVRAYVEEACGDGHHAVYRGDDGTLWITPPVEPGVRPIPPDGLERDPRTETVPVGTVDVPSGTLVVALAYPPLNMTTDGDHAGVTHGAGERLDVIVGPAVLSITRERTAEGQVLALRVES